MPRKYSIFPQKSKNRFIQLETVFEARTGSTRTTALPFMKIESLSGMSLPLRRSWLQLSVTVI